jgi:hypothetical protein
VSCSETERYDTKIYLAHSSPDYIHKDEGWNKGTEYLKIPFPLFHVPHALEDPVTEDYDKWIRQQLLDGNNP